LCRFCFRAWKILIRPLSFSFEQEIKHYSLPNYKNETSIAFPYDTSNGHIHYASNANIIDLSPNESTDNIIVENRNNYIYDTYIENANSIDLLKKIETTNMKKKLDLNTKEQPVEFEHIHKDKYEKSLLIESHLDKKDNTEKEIIKDTHKLKAKIEYTEALDELDEINGISQSNNEIAATTDFKLTNKKAIFVGILVSLARKRLK